MRWGILCAALTGLTIASAAMGGDKPACTLTAADKAANALLSYDDFDQKGSLPSSWRALSNARCDLLAAEAAEDYMLHHEGLTQGLRLNLLFHEGQSLAMAGEERIAAKLVAAAKDLEQKPDDPFDWNTYVEGSWAFLVKNRPALDAAAARLSAAKGKENAINARVLRGLQACFAHPYREAYGPACIKP
jgi:hypothetical protein